MNKSPAHRVFSGWGTIAVLSGVLIIVCLSSLSPPSHLLVGVPLIFLAAPDNYAVVGGNELGTMRVAKIRGMSVRGLLHDDDDDDDEKTPKPTKEGKVTPTSTPEAEPTQPITQVVVNTVTQPLPEERPTRKPPTATPPLSHLGSGLLASTPTPSQTPGVTVTPTATLTPVATVTDVPSSTPEPDGDGIVKRLIPQAPIVREFLPYQLPLAILTSLLLYTFHIIWLRLK